MRAGLLLLLPLLLLAGCKQAEEAAPPPPVPVVPAAPSLAKATESVSYRCAKDFPITAIYGTNAQGQSDVALVVKGQSFALLQTEAASGARYAGPVGLTPGMGLVWWSKGDEALLQQVPADKIADQAAAQTIRTCERKK